MKTSFWMKMVSALKRIQEMISFLLGFQLRQQIVLERLLGGAGEVEVRGAPQVIGRKTSTKSP